MDGGSAQPQVTLNGTVVQLQQCYYDLIRLVNSHITCVVLWVKPGIWKDISNMPMDNQASGSILENEPGSRYEDIFIKNQTYSEEKESINTSIVKVEKPTKVSKWFEQYAISTNNISNFS